MTALVLDASVAISAVIEEAQSELAARFCSELPRREQTSRTSGIWRLAKHFWSLNVRDA